MTFRWLLLHAAGGNAEIFRMQMAPLMYALAEHDDVSFHFAEGPLEMKEAPTKDIWSLYDPPFKTWMDQNAYKGDLTTWIESHDIVRKAVQDEGPFDGIIGYSAGAMVASDILLRDRARGTRTFKCGVFIGGCKIRDLWSTNKGESPVLGGPLEGVHIKVPTVHFYGERDLWLSEIEGLRDICEPSVRDVVVHSGDHDLPEPGRAWDELAVAVRKAMRL